MSDSTDEVFNQSEPLLDVDLYALDAPLTEAVRREGAGWAEPQLHAFGARVGSAEVSAWGFEANRHVPVLRTHDRNGRRLDQVDYHPSYHRLMELSLSNGLHSLHWRHPRPGAHVARAALMLLSAQNEYGHLCPVSMTSSAVPVLRKQSRLAAEWEPRVTAPCYDASSRPAHRKRGVLIGMAMTEKQGGSDVRANTSRAEPLSGGEHRLIGHKWFCSAPMSDAFLVLAQAPAGLSCFFVPRLLPDGERNGIAIQRLKDKLGNRSNASSEIELDGAIGMLVGDEGRGVAVIIDMVNHTRLDCALGSAALMRQGLLQALHHCRSRVAFATTLARQPLMKAVLADLALESEAATVLSLRLARAYDVVDADPAQQALRRVATSLAKYWIGKRAIAHTAEALECLGGNGYTEDFITARLYREAPVNSVWEGSGNVICLDVLRAFTRSPETADALLSELELAAGGDRRLDVFVAALRSELRAPERLEPGRARALVERCALALAGSLLVRHAPAFVADAYCESRLAGERGQCFGSLPHGVDLDAVLDRALPL